MMGQITELDRVLEQKAVAFERYVASADSIGMWETIGWVLLIVIVGLVAFAVVRQVVGWMVKSWRHMVAGPVYMGLVLVIVWAVHRLAVAVGVMPGGLWL